MEKQNRNVRLVFCLVSSSCDQSNPQLSLKPILDDENHDIAIAMSPSRADPVLPWLGVFKCLFQSHCTVWGYLNI